MKAFLTVLVLLLTAPLLAQAPTYSFTFDVAQADAPNITRVEIQVDTTTRSVALPTPSNDSTTPAGFNTYRVSMLAAERSPGRHDAMVRACNATICGLDSNAFTYTVPQRPQNLVIRPGGVE